MSHADKSQQYEGLAESRVDDQKDVSFPSAESMGLTVESSGNDSDKLQDERKLHNIFAGFLRGELTADDLVAFREELNSKKLLQTQGQDALQQTLPGINMTVPPNVDKIKARSYSQVIAALPVAEEIDQKSSAESIEPAVESVVDFKKDSLFPDENDDSPWFEPFSREKALDFVDSLALQNQTDLENKRYLKAAKRGKHIQSTHPGWRPIKSLGKAFTSVPLALLKAPLKGIDALLPDTLQTGPKLEMIDSLRTDKERRLAEAEEDYLFRLEIINSSYGAVIEYITGMSDDDFNAIASDWHNSTAGLTSFVVECINDEQSSHAAAVSKIREVGIAELEKEYQNTRRAIESDESAEFVAEGIRNSSWLLQSLRPPSASIPPEMVEEDSRNSQVYFENENETDVDVSDFGIIEEEKKIEDEKKQLQVYIGKLQSDAEKCAQKSFDKAQKRGILSGIGKAFSGIINQFKPVNLVQIEALQKRKKEAYARSQAKANMDFQVISTGFSAVLEYILNEYGYQLDRFDTTDNKKCQHMVDSLLSDTNTQGYYEVRKIKDRLIRESANASYEEEQRILTTDSSEDINELAKGSRLIRMRDAVRSAIGLPVDYSEDQPELKPIETQPTLMIGVAGSDNSDSSSNVSEDEVTKHQKDKTRKRDRGNLPPSGTINSKKRSPLWIAIPAILAGAAAFFVKGHNSIEDFDSSGNHGERNQKTQLSPAPSTTHEKPFTRTAAPKQLPASPVVLEKPREVAQEVTKPKQVVKRPVKSKPTKSEQHTVAKSAVSTRPPLHGVHSDLPKDTVEDKTPSAEIRDETTKNLTEVAKQAKLREAFALVSGYERRIDAFLQNIKQYAGIIAKHPFLIPKIGGLPTQMKQQLDKLQTVETVEEADKILFTLNTFSALISAEELKLRDLDLGSAETSLQMARKKLNDAQNLSSVPSFKITHYPQNTDGGVVAPKVYNVNLPQIKAKLDALNTKLAPAVSSKVSPMEASLARRDAVYWQGYMDFVLWNLKYNKQAIRASVN